VSGQGLLSTLLKSIPIGGLNLQPTLTQREIVLEITAEQFKQMALSGLTPEAKATLEQAVSVEFHEGKATIKVRLW